MSEGGAAVIRSVLRTVVPVLVAVTSLVASACGGGSTLTAPTPTTIGETPATTSAPATTEAPSVTVTPSTTVPVSTSMAPSTSVAPTTSLAGGPIPEAAAGFCAELAVESGELILEVERVLPDDGLLDPRSQHALLLATRNLLAWTNNRVPAELRADVGLLNRVYADLGIQLDRLNPETVTMPRLQALVFTYVLDSQMVEAGELDLSARRLGAFVDQACGHGFPIMESMPDLFAPVSK